MKIKKKKQLLLSFNTKILVHIRKVYINVNVNIYTLIKVNIFLLIL
jgi:hypothetical protein